MVVPKISKMYQRGQLRWVRTKVTGILLALIMSFSMSSAFGVQSRSTLDRPDDVAGYQIHFVYVVPADGSDNSWDTNRKINTWIDAAQTWLQAKVNRQLIVDSSNQEYDITFLKSKYTVAEMKITEGTTLLNDLTNEIAPVIGASSNPKTYLYIIDGDVSSTYCGRGQTYSNQGMLYGSPLCLNADFNDYSTSYYGLRFISSAILHEYFHTLGVSHTCYNNSDLMIGVPECLSTSNPQRTSQVTIDTARQYYFGGDKSGADISRMPIWKGNLATPVATEWVQKDGYSYEVSIEAGRMFAIVGKTTPGFSWTFVQPQAYGGITALSIASCTITYKDLSIPGMYTDRKCIFDIPNTWRVGKEFVVHADIKSGPFWAKTTSTGTLLRSDYSKSTCTTDFCFTNETWSSLNYQWQEDLESVWLQELVNDEWKTLESSNFVKKSVDATSYFTTEFAPLNFTTAGLHIIRQYIPASTRYGEYRGTPTTVIVLDPTAAEPTTAEISDAKLQSEKILQEFNARIAALLVAE